MGPGAKKVLIVSLVLLVLAAVVGGIVYATTRPNTSTSSTATSGAAASGASPSPTSSPSTSSPSTATSTATAAPPATSVPVAAPKPVTYSALPNMDHFGDDLAGSPFSTMEATKAFCDATPSCKGYNSGGYAKNNVSSPVPSNGITLYQKVGA